MKFKISCFVIFLFILAACDLFGPKDPVINVEKGTMVDIDSNVYQTVKIGDQWWMAENLKVTHYRDGTTLIPMVTVDSVWSNLVTGAYCYYENNEEYIDSLGCIYNWYAVGDTRQLAPEGWHVASDEEWKELEMYVGMSQNEADGELVRGSDEGNKLKSLTSWTSNNGTDIYGFSLLGIGYRRSYGVFMNIGWSSPHWTSTEKDSANAWLRSTTNSETRMFRMYDDKRIGFYIRCVKDSL